MNLVQIGVWKANDDFSKFVKSQLGVDNILLIDAMDKHDEEVKECYDGIPYEFLHVAVVANPDQKQATFYASSDNNGYGAVSSLVPNHILKHGVRIQEEMVVPAKTLTEIFDERGLVNIEVLAVDAEGFDDKILLSLDLNKYNIKFITYEQIHVDTKKVKEHLHKHGYKQSQLAPFKDIVFEKQ